MSRKSSRSSDAAPLLPSSGGWTAPSQDDENPGLRKHGTGALLRRALQVHGSIWASEVLDEFELTPPQFGVLEQLYETPDIDQTALGSGAFLDRSTAGDIVARLVERGLVQRRHDAKDRRRRLLSLTDAGRARYLAARPRTANVRKRLLAGLSDQQAREFNVLLAKLVLSGESDLRT